MSTVDVGGRFSQLQKVNTDVSSVEYLGGELWTEEMENRLSGYSLAFKRYTTMKTEWTE